MTKLRYPLRHELDDAPAEHEYQRTWQGILRRRERRQARFDVRTLGIVAAAATVCVAALLFFFQRLVVPPALAGALTLRGQPLAQFVTASTEPLELSDGSRIELDAGARLEVLENSGGVFVTVLRSGQALFDVKPGGPRRWSIEAGLASVEVVGTRFVVARRTGSVQVTVEHGVVVVRGEHVPDQVRRLTAGESLSISAESTALSGGAALPSAAAVGQEPEPERASSTGPTPAASTHLPSFDELIVQADAERRHGQTRSAEKTLQSALAIAPDSHRAALTAFTLGKVQLDGLGNAAAAAQSFSKAVRLGPPAAIAEDALGRLVEAEGRAGQRDKARRDALEYQKRYPDARRSYAVRRWLEEP